jgi:transposase
MATGARGSPDVWRGLSRRCASASPATCCAASASSPRPSRRSSERSPAVAAVAPQLLTEPGFGPLTAAKLVGEIAGAGRFSTDAKLARAAGVAPIPVSSGKTNRHRLDRGGNRQINATLHRIAITRLRCHPETQDYIARKRAEGKSTKEAIRCLKRHLARRVWHLLQAPHPVKGTPPSPSIS